MKHTILVVWKIHPLISAVLGYMEISVSVILKGLIWILFKQSAADFNLTLTIP